jgi:hypothetical protein
MHLTITQIVVFIGLLATAVLMAFCRHRGFRIGIWGFIVTVAYITYADIPVVWQYVILGAALVTNAVAELIFVRKSLGFPNQHSEAAGGRDLNRVTDTALSVRAEGDGPETRVQ